ncbi:addiction module toxin RelE [Solitalea longa]|uniref:Addiction module toxin RelE n=1 Tax=Solitalea longa TaxID=2079460 RepID=A0A2S4ZZ93_9SPHI|nr:type II toxin-antitoxin system HigB family toxin [Solitalea longa]POY35369.1 addiction module toxin RelE [Solitalea longa]
MFNIITRKTLLYYCKQYPDAERSLNDWYKTIVKSDFKNFNELKELYRSASIVSDNRVVFNIMGNNYRLVVRFSFEFKTIHPKWFGTHTEYNSIDGTTVNNK